MVAMQVFRKGTSPVSAIRAIVEQADDLARHKDLVYIVRHVAGQKNPADKPSREVLGQADLFPWKLFWQPSRFALHWHEYIQWIQKVGNTSVDISTARALVTVLLTKQLKVAAIDIFFKEIYACDELYEGDAAKVLAQAFLHNVRTVPIHKNEGKRRAYLQLIANRLGTAGVLTHNELNDASSRRVSRDTLDVRFVTFRRLPAVKPTAEVKFFNVGHSMAKAATLMLGTSFDYQQSLNKKLQKAKYEDLKEEDASMLPPHDQDPDYDSRKAIYEFRSHSLNQQLPPSTHQMAESGLYAKLAQA
jgi:hypothetical protein